MIKYIEGMTMCIKDHAECLYELDIQGTITVTCDYEYDGFCLFSDGGCDFLESLSQENADMLNKGE